MNKKIFVEEVLSELDTFYVTDKADGVRTLLYIT